MGDPHTVGGHGQRSPNAEAAIAIEREATSEPMQAFPHSDETIAGRDDSCSSSVVARSYLARPSTGGDLDPHVRRSRVLDRIGYDLLNAADDRIGTFDVCELD